MYCVYNRLLGLEDRAQELEHAIKKNNKLRKKHIEYTWSLEHLENMKSISYQKKWRSQIKGIKIFSVES